MNKSDYPRDAFVSEAKRTSAMQVTGGWADPGNTLELKFVAPEFTVGAHNVYEVRSALVVYQTTIHDDMVSALTPGARVQGIGTVSKPPKKDRADLVHQGADIIVGQMAAGGLFGLGVKLKNKFMGIQNSSSHQVELNLDGVSIGSVHMQSVVLPSVHYLQRNGFPKAKFEDEMQSEVPETGVFLVKIQASFTPEQVDEIFDKTRQVKSRYGVPRLTARVGMPETHLGNLGGAPHAKLHSATRHTSWTKKAPRKKDRDPYGTHSQKIPIEPVRHIRGNTLETLCNKTIDSSVAKLKDIYNDDPELRMRHVAARIHQVYTQCTRKAVAFCRNGGYAEQVPQVMACFESALRTFCLEQEKENSVGSVYLPISFASSTPLPEEAYTGAFMKSEGNDLLAKMTEELAVTAAVSDQPFDYIVRLYEEAEQIHGRGQSVLLPENEIQFPDSEEIVTGLIEKRITSFKGTIKGWKKIERRKRKKQNTTDTADAGGTSEEV